MAIVVKTENPSGLLSAIKRAIDIDEVRTWSYDTEGNFTHTTEQWARLAWLRPIVREDGLVFNIIPPRGRTISRVADGIYHARFIEMLLNHFDKRFANVSATALPTPADRVRGQLAGV